MLVRFEVFYNNVQLYMYAMLGQLRATSLSTVTKLGAGQSLSCHFTHHWFYCVLN